MAQLISKTGAKVTPVFLAADGTVVPALPAGASLSWSLTDTTAFNFTPNLDGSVNVFATADVGTPSTLVASITGTLTLTGSLDLVQAVVIPPPVPQITALSFTVTPL